MAIKNEGAARGTMRERDEEKNDGTDISIVIKLRIRVLTLRENVTYCEKVNKQ